MKLIELHENMLLLENTKDVLKRATKAVEKDPDKIKNPVKTLKKKIQELTVLGVDVKILKQFWNTFKRKPLLAAVAVTALLLLAPFATGAVGKIAMVLSRLANLTLSGMYVKELLDKTKKKDDDNV